MDLYQIWCDLKPGVRDLEFADRLRDWLGLLERQGAIAGWRLTRRKLGFGPPGLGEFHIIIETENLAQLDRAFQLTAGRAGVTEVVHAGVNQLVRNFTAALTRDFPDPARRRGEERF